MPGAVIVARDDLHADSGLLDHLRGLGIDARQTIQPGYADMMAEPHYTKVPHEAIAEIVSWMRGGAGKMAKGEIGRKGEEEIGGEGEGEIGRKEKRR